MCAVGGNPRARFCRAILRSRMHAVLAALKTDTTNTRRFPAFAFARACISMKTPKICATPGSMWPTLNSRRAIRAPKSAAKCCSAIGASPALPCSICLVMSSPVKVFLDLLPDMEPQDKVDFIWEQSMAHPSRTAAEVMSGLLPSRVARAVVVAGGLNPDEPIIAEQEAVVLAMVSESFGLSVRGIADPKQAQVTRGGFATECFDAHTFECREHAGLFACGEALDVDGRCGGYNLHWAWTSGLLAGASAAMSKMPPRVLSRGFRWARLKVWRNALVAQRFRAMKAVVTSVRAASARAAKAAFVLPANAATARAAAKRGAMGRPAARRAVEAPMRATSVAKARTAASAARVASEAMLAPLVPMAATMAGKGPTGARS